MAKKEKRSSSSSCSREEEEEIVKAAAWAWYLHGSGATIRPVKESNPRAAQSAARPSRFKIESLALSGSPSRNTRRGRSMSLDDSGDFRGAQRVFTPSSLLDSYEMAVVSRQLESGLSDAISRGKSVAHLSGKSWIDRGISGELCNSNPSKVSRLHKTMRVPAMCSSTSVFVPGEMESVRKRPQHKKWQSGLLSGLARKVLFLSDFYIK